MYPERVVEYTRGINVDAAKCDGCGDCAEACRRAVAGQHRHTDPFPRIWVQQVDHKQYPVLCHNCEQAPCVSACMTGCRHRVGDFVTTDYARCVGCSMCVMCCPFGAIELVEEEHLALKCDGCLDEETAPCVAACQKGALRHVGYLQSVSETRYAGAAALAFSSLLAASKKGGKP
ncbi:MAG: 4Fe-4S dicluster domain-containing protein [Thermaerobacter sp.]|nr:4Fe-4S dicluster domain-containing protein [Thermaerobacter sp.]